MVGIGIAIIEKLNGGEKLARTVKNIIHEGYTTYTEDGRKFITHKNVINEGYTTYEAEPKPKKETATVASGSIGGDLGGSAILLVVALVLALSCAKILDPIAYVFAGIAIITPLIAGLLERIHISRLWASGVLFCWATLKLIDVVHTCVFSSASNDGGAKAMTICALGLFVIIGLYLAVHGVGEETLGFLSFGILMPTLAISFLGSLGGEKASETYIREVMHIPFQPLQDFMLHWQDYAFGLLIVIAAIQQIILIARFIKQSDG